MTFFDMRTRWKRITQEMDEDKQEAFLIDAYDVFRVHPWLTITAHIGLLVLVILCRIMSLKVFSDALYIVLVAHILIYWVLYIRKMFKFMNKWEKEG